MALRILLADDSQHAQRDGSRILSELGYEVVAVNNGAAALAELEQSAFDLVIADTSMPGLSGLEICERIRQRAEWAKMPVLLALAAFELFDSQQGKRAGADEVIQKPFIPSALERAVQNLLSAAGKLPPEPAAVAPPPPGAGPAAAMADTPPLPLASHEPEAGEPEPSAHTAEFPAPPETPLVAEAPGGAGRPRWEIAALEVVSGEALAAEHSAASEGAVSETAASEAPEAAVRPSSSNPPGEVLGEDADWLNQYAIGPEVQAGGELAVLPVAAVPPPSAAPAPVLAMAAAAGSGATGAVRSAAPPAAPLSGTGPVPGGRESAALPAPAEPEDVLLTAWREAMSAPIATAPQVDLAAALNAVDEILSRYLAPIIAGEASEQIASRLRALAH